MASEDQLRSSSVDGFPVSKELSHALLESMPVNVIFKDLGGRILFANQRFCQESGSRPGELIGKTDYDLFPQEMADKYRRDDADVLKRGGVLHDVERHLNIDGDIRYVEVFKTPVQDAQGHHIGVQVLFWDVTERKLADEQFEDEQHQIKSLTSRIPEIALRLDRVENDFQARETMDALQEVLTRTSAALARLSAGDSGSGRES
ncbi:aerobic respiration control sensor protein ArcB [Symmachiella macrocystis]|uniref:Aerobic respiration control sensor protein ArcB n=1 Tax=Symmachiella macrocystis TaxID=2527985 RepID=A0A5C6BNT3_9PLAN|nr:PAS domain-containing protein [Symmachiella macrocystis]TWU13698.1 aerobic respiration control sensor protein ArcB [Symmachiella macrocystis]